MEETLNKWSSERHTVGPDLKKTTINSNSIQKQSKGLMKTLVLYISKEFGFQGTRSNILHNTIIILKSKNFGNGMNPFSNI